MWSVGMFSWKAELGEVGTQRKLFRVVMAFQSLSQTHGLSRGVEAHSPTLPRGALGAICCMCKLRGRFPLSTAAPRLLVGGSCECLLNALCGLSEASLAA